MLISSWCAVITWINSGHRQLRSLAQVVTAKLVAQPALTGGAAVLQGCMVQQMLKSESALTTPVLRFGRRRKGGGDSCRPAAPLSDCLP